MWVCRSVHTCALLENGQLYAWGKSEYTGHGHTQDVWYVPSTRQLGSIQKYTSAKTYLSLRPVPCAVLTVLAHVHRSPLLLDGFDHQRIVQVSVGPGGYHTIALSATGDVYTWGHNRVGQLGYKNTEMVPRNVEGAFFLPAPRLVESLRDKRVVRVVAGWGHSAAVCRNGDVYTCGR